MLEGQVALVTGGGRGIGRAIAERLAQAGATPVLNYLDDREHADATLAAVRRTAPRALAIAADVRDAAAVQRMVDQIVTAFGRIDILVNNAGIARDGFLHKLTDEQWHDVIATNLTGVYNVTRRVMPHMRAARSGRVATISSVIGFTGNLGQAAYAASKAGVMGFTRSVALEIAALGVRVNAVAPGFIRTGMLEAIPRPIQDATLQRIPIGAFGETSDIADAVLFLVGPSSRYITGQVIHVNGGLYL